MRALLLAGLLGVSACVSLPVSGSNDRLAELDRACRERGGVLVPSAGPFTGRPETDNICRISGGATRLPGR